jgi:hypothetical protein
MHFVTLRKAQKRASKASPFGSSCDGESLACADTWDGLSQASQAVTVTPVTRGLWGTVTASQHPKGCDVCDGDTPTGYGRPRFNRRTER